LEELAAGDDRLRDTFPLWLAERDRQNRGPKKPPQSDNPSSLECNQKPLTASGE
jgi:hypothetical protein